MKQANFQAGGTVSALMTYALEKKSWTRPCSPDAKACVLFRALLQAPRSRGVRIVKLFRSPDRRQPSTGR